ncbi:MAG: LamG-like jellyroll fold domain-containing protein, partial [Planctomycetota bacterium]
PFTDADGNLVAVDPLVSDDVITGWADTGGNGNLIPLTQAFATSPLVVANAATRDGADGGWMRRGAVTPGSVRLTSDEDTFTDGERGHTTERASVLAVSEPFRLAAPGLPTPTLTYATQKDTTGNGQWENEQGIGSHNWNLNSNARTAVANDPAAELTQAYVFPGARGAMSSLQGLSGNPTDDSASFEIWFKPSDLTGQEILLETGGNVNGTGMAVDGDSVVFVPSSNSGPTTKRLAAAGLTDTAFAQAIGVIDLEGTGGATGAPDLYLYLNGVLADSALDVAGFTDWAGSDGSGLGRVNGTIGGNKTGLLSGFGNFDGQIAAVRFYESALTADDALNLYRSVAVPEPATVTLLALGGLAAALRRKKNH